MKLINDVSKLSSHHNDVVVDNERCKVAPIQIFSFCWGTHVI